MIDYSTEREALLHEVRMVALADAIDALRRAVGKHSGHLIEQCTGYVDSAAIKAELSSDLQTSLGYQLRAIEENLRFSPTQPTRQHTLRMVSLIENLVEEFA